MAQEDRNLEIEETKRKPTNKQIIDSLLRISPKIYLELARIHRDSWIVHEIKKCPDICLEYEREGTLRHICSDLTVRTVLEYIVLRKLEGKTCSERNYRKLNPIYSDKFELTGARRVPLPYREERLDAESGSWHNGIRALEERN